MAGEARAQEDERTLLAGRGTFIRKGVKAATGAVSSALERLKGTTIQGKAITDIRKGGGKFRTVFFEDGTSMTLTADDITDLARAQGTHKYIDRFEAKGSEGKTQQALKSLKFHEARSKLFESREGIRRHHKAYLQSLKEMGEELPPDTDFVVRGNKYFVMPKAYAKHLEEMGILKVMKGIKEKRILK